MIVLIALRLWQGFLWAGSGLRAACFFLFRKSYNWCHLQWGRYKLRQQRARYEREVPLEVRLRQQQRLHDLNQRLAAEQPTAPYWHMPPTGRQLKQGLFVGH
jgi:hypothetical protein